MRAKHYKLVGSAARGARDLARAHAESVTMPAGAAEDFVAKCREHKLDFVVFVRHASSAPLHEGAAKRAEKPHDWKIDDQMRVLTQKGKDQCAAAAWFRELDVRAALTCVEINQCVGCAAMLAPARRWRGDRRGYSGRTRRKILISTAPAT